jgi:two-component system, cell cycle sensor histidine kinase and response regulator CckA
MTGSILLIDDEADSLSLLKGILAAEGYRVRSADSGRLALASLAGWLPELILLDIRMPGMNGFEVYRRLRAIERLKNVPVMFISAASEPEERIEGLALGAVDHISKPFRREELLARVRTHVELGRLRKDLENQVSEKTSELRKSVEQLRESEVRFRNMADTAPVMIWVSDTDKLCTFFNKTWLVFTGRTLEQEYGNGWIDGVHPDDRDRCCAIYRSFFDAREPFQMEYRLLRADGEYRWLLDRGIPRFAPGGAFAGYIGSAFDITDLKRIHEEALSREKLQSLVALTRGIAHDFNNMLGAIVAQAELAETELAEGSSPTDEVHQIKAVASRASEMVRELMIYAGQDAVTLGPVNLSELVEEMSELLRVSIPRKCSLHLDLCRDLPRVRGSATQLRQLVMNLIINASQAIGDAGGSIHVRTLFPAGRVRSASTDGTDYIRLEISDTGCGMTDEQKARIFDPFFTTKSQGHGLGLAVVQGIVQSHGGAIDVVSAVGQGSTFEVLFQCVGAQSEVAFPVPSASASAGLMAASGIVLLVEDEDALRTATATLLQKTGFSVVGAADGQSAMEIFCSRPDEIAVVVLDLNLPILSGQEVYRQIRAMNRETKIILTSGYANGIAEADQSVRFLQKPYPNSNLISALHEALSESRGAAANVETSSRSTAGGRVRTTPGAAARMGVFSGCPAPESFPPGFGYGSGKEGNDVP